MKIEINNENKARFFALYYDLPVFFQMSFVKGQDLRAICNNKELENYGKEAYLTLKPLSSISDEDAIEVARIYGLKGVQCRSLSQFGIKDFGTKHGEITLYNDLSMGGSSNCIFETDYFTKNIVFDYLRSRSYLLPWMGLSCEEIIDAGWAKHETI